MYKDKKCRACNGLNEFIYEIDRVAHYYCACCDKETREREFEAVGPEQRMKEETGEWTINLQSFLGFW